MKVKQILKEKIHKNGFLALYFTINDKHSYLNHRQVDNISLNDLLLIVFSILFLPYTSM